MPPLKFPATHSLRHPQPLVLPLGHVLDWCACVLSFTGLLLIAQIGALGALLFLAPWALIGFTRPQSAASCLMQNSLLLALPALCLISTAWSDNPMATLRASIQFLLTISIGILAGCSIGRRIFISAAFCALMLVCVAGIAFGVHEYNPYIQSYQLLGLFESKNQMATCGVFLTLTALTITADAGQPRLLRIVAIVAIGLGVYVVHEAKSAGATIFVGPAIFAFLFMLMLSALPRLNRVAVLIGGVLVVLPVVIAAVISIANPDMVLEALGKDATLTGRTELWKSALLFWQEKPLFGLGYQAFWQIGNPRAEELWFINNVESGAGFHFHNLFLNTAVELGLFGVSVVIIVFVLMTVHFFISIFHVPSPSQFFAASVFVYLFLISFMEVLQSYQFHIATVFFCCAWCYLKTEALSSKDSSAP